MWTLIFHLIISRLTTMMYFLECIFTKPVQTETVPKFFLCVCVLLYGKSLCKYNKICISCHQPHIFIIMLTHRKLNQQKASDFSIILK